MIKLLILISLSFNAYASSQRLLKCLGQEELKFHKAKVDSPLSKLNREVISAFIQFRDSIKISSEKTKELCDSKHPALNIIKEIITAKKGVSLFTSDYDQKSFPREYAMDKMTLDQFESNTYKIFLNYLFSIQARVESEKCLLEKVPGLKSFFTKMQFTLEEEGMRKIFKGLKRPQLIFNILSDIESGDISCARLKSQK
jgi:hypothetical protein